jgi:MerR family transcriptional regulator, light-induced transcriptional regulator
MTNMMGEPGALRIGELSRRTGVPPELLRAWERRYALLQPARSPGGFRLYSTADVARVRAMQGHLARGVAAAQAARLALADDVAVEEQRTEPALAQLGADLRHALDRLDESGAHQALDGLLAAFTIETALAEGVLPYLAELGERWAGGEVSVAGEHFASSLIRGRLLALARGWDAGSGPRAILACAPGEQHDLGLISFGLVLRRHGWRIAFLGPDTPFESVAEAAQTLDAELVMISATVSDRFASGLDLLAVLADAVRVAVAGDGATPELAEATGAELIDLGPVEAAEWIAGR